MAWLLGLLAVYSGSLLIIINALRKAPEAFEGEHGLYILRPRLRGAGVVRNKKSSTMNRRPSGQKAKSTSQTPASHSA